MKKIYLGLLISICLISFVVAGDLIATQFTKDMPIDKTTRDYLLTKVPTILDKNKAPLTKEIKPTINIVCSATECKYSAVQEGIISSYDNLINRMYCSEYDKEGNCTKISAYSIIEIQDQVSKIVNLKLIDYATSSINQDSKTVNEISNGTITITEKR